MPDFTDNLLSPATRSLVGHVGKATFGPIDLSPSNASCVPAAAGLQCTLTLAVPVGQDKPFDLTTHASGGGKGPALASASQHISIFPGQNYLTPAMSGIAHELGVAPTTSITFGHWQSVPLVVYAIDAAKRIIPSTQVIGPTGVTVSSVTLAFGGFGSGQSTAACCGVSGNFDYNGGGEGNLTISASSPGFPTATRTVSVSAAGTQFGTIIVSGGSTPSWWDSCAQFQEFSAGSSGDASPLLDILEGPGLSGQGTFPCWFFSEDAGGNFWGSYGNTTTHYSNTLAPLGTVTVTGGAGAADSKNNLYSVAYPCTILEYPPAYGTPSPIRQINVSSQGGGFPGASCGASVVVDDSGDVFATNYFEDQASSIYEYGAGGNGDLTPIRTITIPPAEGVSGIESMAVDGAGNLYITAWAGGFAPLSLLEYAPGSTTPVQLLTGVWVQYATVDQAGDIWAWIYNPNQPGSQSAIEEFAPGSATPELTLPSATGSYDIVVPPSPGSARPYFRRR